MVIDVQPGIWVCIMGGLKSNSDVLLSKNPIEHIGSIAAIVECLIHNVLKPMVSNSTNIKE